MVPKRFFEKLLHMNVLIVKTQKTKIFIDGPLRYLTFFQGQGHRFRFFLNTRYNITIFNIVKEQKNSILLLSIHLVSFMYVD